MVMSELDRKPLQILICRLRLFLLRVLEIKIFKNNVGAYDLVHFMRGFHQPASTPFVLTRNSPFTRTTL